MEWRFENRDWIMAGRPVREGATVQAWMGHASIATTNLYLHNLGTAADLAGLGRLNASGTPGARNRISDERTERGGGESAWNA